MTKSSDKEGSLKIRTKRKNLGPQNCRQDPDDRPLVIRLSAIEKQRHPGQAGSSVGNHQSLQSQTTFFQVIGIVDDETVFIKPVQLFGAIENTDPGDVRSGLSKFAISGLPDNTWPVIGTRREGFFDMRKCTPDKVPPPWERDDAGIVTIARAQGEASAQVDIGFNSPRSPKPSSTRASSFSK